MNFKAMKSLLKISNAVNIYASVATLKAYFQISHDPKDIITFSNTIRPGFELKTVRRTTGSNINIVFKIRQLTARYMTKCNREKA